MSDAPLPQLLGVGPSTENNCDFLGGASADGDGQNEGKALMGGDAVKVRVKLIMIAAIIRMSIFSIDKKQLLLEAQTPEIQGLALPTEPICCTCENSTHCQAKRQPRDRNKPLGPQQPDGFKGKIWYFAIGSESYIPLLEHLRKNLMHVGVSNNDIGFICVDRGCEIHFSNVTKVGRVDYYGVEQIQGTKCLANPNVSNMRCRVSGGKAFNIKKILQEGDAIYFFDADIVFYKHPLSSIQADNPQLTLFTQREGGRSNFGVVLAYPDAFSIGVFEYLFDEFQRTAAFDQGILQNYLRIWKTQHVANPVSDCRGICGDPYDHELLPLSFVSLMTGRYKDERDPNRVLAHATCVEGVFTPILVMTAMFGSPYGADYYLPKKTLTVDKEFFWLTDKVELNHAMKSLVYVAQTTNRSLRIVGNVTGGHMIFYPQSFRLISHDFIIGKLGVDIVEDTYFKRAVEWHGRPEPKRITIPVANTQVLQQLSNNNDIPSDWKDADEWALPIADLMKLDDAELGALAGPSLGYEDGAWERDFTCRIMDTPADARRCLHICDPGHFRR